MEVNNDDSSLKANITNKFLDNVVVIAKNSQILKNN